ncbi:ORF6C domain-containing protein [Bacillus mycoides]|nr:ORF6C domain-containing protein [Bacillus mycoides]
MYKLWNENKVDREVYGSTRKVFSALWKSLKDAYQVNAYPNISQRDFGEAMSFIEGWRPLLNVCKGS